MNVENVKKAIQIMKRAGKVNMDTFQIGTTFALTEQELHACGNSACFAGWVAVSPEFQADGGRVDRTMGYPLISSSFDIFAADEAISYWLDLDHGKAQSLVYGDLDDGYSLFYNKPWTEVTAQDVIAKLEALLCES